MTSILYCIFDFEHFSSKIHVLPVKKKANGYETGIFLERKLKKKSATKRHRKYSLFLIFDIFRQKQNALMPVFFQKKSNRYESGMFLKKKIIKSAKKGVDSRFLTFFVKNTTLSCPFFKKKIKWASERCVFGEKKSKKVQSFIG